MYNFCKTFKVSPREYGECYAEDVDILGLIDQEMRAFEKEELEKERIKNKHGR